MRIIDITVPMKPGMVVWPGQDRYERQSMETIAGGGMCNLTQIITSVHAGTHVDAPCHFIDGAPAIDQVDLEAFVGPCRVVAVEGRESIDRADLEPLALEGVERLLIKTSNSALLPEPEFVESYAGLTAEAAHYLAGLESLRLVGLDYYSIAPYDDQAAVAVHNAILGRAIVPLEGVDLTHVEPGNYELVALPLRIEASDGSPVRAILIERD